MQQVEGHIAELGCLVRECIGCGSLVVGGPSRCMNCVREMEAPRKFAGITAGGWVVVFGANLICAAVAVAIALLT